MAMLDPPHPGKIIREDCLKPLGLSVNATAQGLDVTRKSLSDLLNGYSRVSPEMAIRLEKAGWSTADHWLRMQFEYDLWDVKQRAATIKVSEVFGTGSGAYLTERPLFDPPAAG